VTARAIIAGCLFAIAACAHAQTPEARLFEAIEAGKALVAEGIVLHGAVKLDARNRDQETPLHRAIEKEMRELAAMLVKAGAPIRTYSVLGVTPLHLAALHADPWWVDLLLAAKADPNMRNDDGESALQWAVMTGNPLAAKHLLEHGADPKITDLRGNTLLHAAADGGYLEMVSAFLALGVDPRQKNRASKRPIDVAREQGHAQIVKLLERFEKD
jgi:ankyrin repeat protein